MTFDGEAFGKEMTEIVKDHVERATAPLIKRIEELEARQPEKGEPGQKGDKGDAGVNGVGIAGAIISRSGELVVTLSDGTTRELGVIVGKDGADGRDGRDADMSSLEAKLSEMVSAIPVPVNGKDGRDADMPALEQRLSELVSAIPVPVNGKDGADGRDADMDALLEIAKETALKAVAEIPVPKDGKDGQDAYPGQAKGLYDPEAEYRALDVVTLNGSEWRAKQDDPGPLPGDGWMLSAQRGKRGDRGEKGDRGGEGKAGTDGAQPVGIQFDESTMKFVMVLDDGNLLEADFYPVAKAIRGES